jgi:predicted acetyltransferase
MNQAIAQPAITRVVEGERVRLRRMLKTYLAELGVESAYPHFDLYWREDGRYPYWIEVGESNVGFALVRQMENGACEVAEFYIEPSWRRQGVGAHAAKALFAAHPGSWQVCTFPLSPSSQAFWAKAVPFGAQRQIRDQRSVFLFTVANAV